MDNLSLAKSGLSTLAELYNLANIQEAERTTLPSGGVAIVYFFNLANASKLSPSYKNHTKMTPCIVSVGSIDHITGLAHMVQAGKILLSQIEKRYNFKMMQEVELKCVQVYNDFRTANPKWIRKIR